MYQAHSTAIIDSSAQIGQGTTIGPYSIIGPKVTLGKNNTIKSHVVLEGNTTIGNNNIIYQFASIGSAPQDQKWQGHDTLLILGDNNQIREYVTIQPATNLDGVTKIGNNNLFMACSHVAHDVTIGDGCQFANAVCIAGHVEIANKVIIGGLTGVHQLVSIGEFAFIAAGSLVAQDIPPFCMAQGDRAKLIQINKIGLARNNFSESDIRKLQTIFRKLFYQSGAFEAKCLEIKNEYQDFAPLDKIFEFINLSKRGLSSCARFSR
jgi:UDP-N-acetylglucosamine acyltransferase